MMHHVLRNSFYLKAAMDKGFNVFMTPGVKKNEFFRL